MKIQWTNFYYFFITQHNEYFIVFTYSFDSVYLYYYKNFFAFVSTVAVVSSFACIFSFVSLVF